jgi:S-adenosylmethionine synthetase
MAVEATIKDNTVIIYGEQTTDAVLDYAKIARGVSWPISGTPSTSM